KDSQHGILCGEVVHALAPAAELLFANWEPDRPDQFLDAVRWARQQGARILSCSLIMPSWSDGEGGGSIHAALARLLGKGDQADEIVAHSSARVNVNRYCAVARFYPNAAHDYRVRVRLARGPAGPFHLVALGGSLEYASARGSIPFPADGPEVVAVGAVTDAG